MLQSVAATKKPKKTQLSDAENDAVQSELERLLVELKTKRAVGLALKFPFGSSQQTISRAMKARAGREVAEALYRYLNTTRETFLRNQGINELVALQPVTFDDRISEVIARVAKVLGFTHDEVTLASSMVRGFAGISMTEEIARELLERARSNRRDVKRMFRDVVADTGASALEELGGGVPKARARRSKR